MSEEEIKAVKIIKQFKSIKILYGNTFVMYIEQLIKYQEASETILNLIEKQQKEIEELKNTIAVANKLEYEIKEKFIPKSKIEDKIKENEKYFEEASDELQNEFYEIHENVIRTLKGLLKEE